MKFQIVQFCKGCIEDVMDGEIEFTIPTIVNQVHIGECDNVDVEKYNSLISARGKIELKGW